MTQLAESLARRAYDSAMHRPKLKNYGATWGLPNDELASKAAEARKDLEVRRVKGVLIEEQPVSFLKPLTVPEESATE